MAMHDDEDGDDDVDLDVGDDSNKDDVGRKS